MNFSTNWRDRRTVFRPSYYSIANYSTETKNDMKTTFGDDLFLKNLHLIPDPLMKNLADTIITEEKKSPKSKLDTKIDVKTNENTLNMHSDYSPLSGITSFFSGVMNVISNVMFSNRKQEDFIADTDDQMAVPSMWHGAKLSDENKILLDENHSNEMGSDLLVSEMTDCREAAAHCQNKIEQVRLLLSSKPVPCSLRTKRRPKKVYVEASSVEDCFEDAFSPEDFGIISNESYNQYSTPVSYNDHILHEVDSPRVKIESAGTPKMVTDLPPVNESVDIVPNVPEIDTTNENKLDCDTKKELVASCEDKISKLKALLQEKRKKPTTVTEPFPTCEVEPKQSPKPKTASKVKDKRFKNPNRCCSTRMKTKMKNDIQDDLQIANEINSEDLSSLENSPAMSNFEKYIVNTPKTDKEYFDEVSGRFHSTSATDSEDSFQIVFSDTPKPRKTSDCDSEDSFIVFEDSPDSCYTSNDVFGEPSDSEDYDSDSSDVSDSGCGNSTFKLASSLSKSISNLTDDSLYVEKSEDENVCAEKSEDEVDCAKEVTSECATSSDLQTGDAKSGLLIDTQKKLLRKNLPAKTVQFSQEPPKVHVMYVWTFAARQARNGHWERFVVDRERFKRRIADVDVAVSWVLKPQHRSRVMFQRFMPWWNAQKRQELAEKKEKEAQEKLKKEEEELRKETEKLKVDEESTDLGDTEEKMRELDKNNGNLSSENGQPSNCEKNAEKNIADNKKRLKNGKGKSNSNIKNNLEVKSEKNITNDANTSGKKTETPLLGEFKKVEQVTDNISNQTANHKIKVDNKMSHKNHNQIIPMNDKILNLNTDFVPQTILNT